MSFGPSVPTTAPAPEAEVRALQYAAAADFPGSEQGDPANVLQPAGTGPDINAGLGLDVTVADFTGRRAGFAGYGSEISLAAYGAVDPGDDVGLRGQGPAPGIFGAFPAGPTEMEAFPSPADAGPGSAATAATPISRARRWRRPRWPRWRR